MSVIVLDIFLDAEVAVAALESSLDAGPGHPSLCLSAHLHHNVSLKKIKEVVFLVVDNGPIRLISHHPIY